MSAMADLDIKLSEYKLSDAQKNAVVEVVETSFPINSKSNTLASLVKKGLIELVEGTQDNYTLSEEFAQDLGLWATVDEVMEELNTNMWDAPVITEEEIEQFKVMGEKVSGVEDEDAAEDLQAYTFDKDWAMWERELLGFEGTIAWKNTDVWHGLTAQEIREDMDTALPIGRKARRERARIVRKVLATV
jgi:hypothetical protein